MSADSPLVDQVCICIHPDTVPGHTHDPRCTFYREVVAVQSPSSEAGLAEIVGRQVRIVGDHPWNGHRAKVVGFDPKLGLRVSIMRNDAMDGHECFIMERKQFIPIPKSLESEQ